MTAKRPVSDEQLGMLAVKQAELFKRVSKGSLSVDGVLHNLQMIIEGKFSFGDSKLILTKPFSPIEFIGKGWEIIEEDPRSLALKEIEVDKFIFETCLREGEIRITGEEKLFRLKEKSDFIPLGSNAFIGLWENYKANKEKSILEWLFLNKGIKFMDFPGTILRSPDGYRNVLYLYRNDGGSWNWNFSWLYDVWHASDPSVGCAS